MQPSGIRTCLGTAGLLLALAALSWWLSRHHLGGWAIPAALGIATIKAGIIATVFIGILRQGGANRLALLAAAAFIACLVGFMSMDVLAR